MLQIFRKKDGAVTVFLTIILVPMIVISCLFVDACRAKLASSVVSSAGDLTLNTALTQYDSVLNDYYGLMASSQSVDEFLTHADEYFQACITSQGVDADTGREWADRVSNILTGETQDISDLLQIEEQDQTKFTIKTVENGTLENPAVVKKEIVEFMKYRAPIDGVSELIDKFKNASRDLENARKNADLVDKKEKFYDSESKLLKRAKDANDAIQAYVAVGLTDTSVEEIKNALTNAESEYRELHKKMVKDLYNTQGISEYKKVDLYENWTPKPEEVNKAQVNGYINNAADTMEDFVDVANRFEAVPDLGYNKNEFYNIQYWVSCDSILKQNNIYSTYVQKAQSMCQNMAKLKAVMDQLTDEEKAETYNLKSYRNIELVGSGTRSELYESLKTQYDELKREYITNPNSQYNYITEILEEISSANKDNISILETDNKIRELNTTFKKYNSDCERAMNALSGAVTELEAVKTLSEQFQQSYETWKNAANSYDTQLAEQDRAQIAEIESMDPTERDDVLQNAKPEKVQELHDRLNNINSLLGSIKKGIGEYKYNGVSLLDIDSYEKMKSSSAVNPNKITKNKTELENYAESSFKFQKSDTLTKTSITDKNNPAIERVNTPDFYKWLKQKFKDYDENEIKNKENEKDAAAHKYDGEIADVTTPNSSSQEEIKDLSDRPAAQYASDKEEGIVSTNVSQISGKMSTLFKDFSGTLNRAAIDLRDDLYFMDYVMNMFSYDTFENEAKYKLCGGDVNLQNYSGKYSSVDSQWKSEDVKVTVNKTLTNKMINSTNNYSYGNEVEYILYGGSNLDNKVSAYGTIFGIRYALNLAPEFQYNWSNDGLNLIAIKIAEASCGIVPAPLFKLVVILGLTAAESARDIRYLKHGIPVKLMKSKDEVEVVYTGHTRAADTHPLSLAAFSYSDYLKLIFFIKITTQDEYMLYARTADVIQANMSKQITPDTGFLMKKANVYYSAEASLKITPLMLDLPITSGYTEGKLTDGIIGRITYKAYRGY